jgi:hypothetical protein
MSTDILVVQINGALPLAYPNNKNRSSDYACVVFIFFYSFGYSIGFGPNAWVYGTEVFLLPPPFLPGTDTTHRSSQRTSVQKASTSVPVQVQSALLLLLNSTPLLCPTSVPKHISYFSVSTQCHLS